MAWGCGGRAPARRRPQARRVVAAARWRTLGYLYVSIILNQRHVPYGAHHPQDGVTFERAE
jgi:hypothetical protein